MCAAVLMLTDNRAEERTSHTILPTAFLSSLKVFVQSFSRCIAWVLSDGVEVVVCWGSQATKTAKLKSETSTREIVGVIRRGWGGKK